MWPWILSGKKGSVNRERERGEVNGRFGESATGAVVAGVGVISGEGAGREVGRGERLTIRQLLLPFMNEYSANTRSVEWQGRGGRPYRAPRLLGRF